MATSRPHWLAHHSKHGASAAREPSRWERRSSGQCYSTANLACGPSARPRCTAPDDVTSRLQVTTYGITPTLRGPPGPRRAAARFPVRHGEGHESPQSKRRRGPSIEEPPTLSIQAGTIPLVGIPPACTGFVYLLSDSNRPGRSATAWAGVPWSPLSPHLIGASP